MMLQPTSKIHYAVIFLSLLSGCDDEFISANNDGSSSHNDTVVTRAGISGSPLTHVNTNKFESFLKNGIRMRATAGIPMAEQMDTSDEASSSNSSGSGNNFSTTNLHEPGVDEADRLKYDGQYLYTLNSINASYATIDGQQSEAVSKIRILKTDIDSAGAHEVASIKMDAMNILSGLYLRNNQNQLLALTNTTNFQYQYGIATVPTLEELRSSPPYPYESTKPSFTLQAFDVITPENPSKQWQLEFEGTLRNSRRIDDKLYLIVQYTPQIIGLTYNTSTDSEQAENERIITETSLSDLLPHYTNHSGEYKPLLTPERCLIPKDSSENQGYAELITLVAVDLDNHEISSAVCINSEIQGIYSATDHLYIGGSTMDNNADNQSLTAIHKFALNDGLIDYQASAGLPGYLAWNDPSFRMHQYQNQLRVVTTEYDNATYTPTHMLHILQDNGRGKLGTISTLPNSEAPEAIGKPGEEIYSVRFTDTRAYLTTFKQIDPLYVLDLIQATKPKIAGQLEISGYSSYLHPISDDWLLGLGHEVIDGQQLGIKMVLFDIRDFENPSIRNQHIIGGAGSYSEALYDLQAFTFLNIDANKSRIAIPVQKRDYKNYSFKGESGLFGFELNQSTSGDLDLSYSGKLITESSASVNGQSQKTSMVMYSPESRSVLHDDVIYYLYGDLIYSGIWGDWDTKQGPF